MEKIINFSVIALTLLVIVCVEFFVSRKHVTKEENAEYGFSQRHDAMTELKKQRKEIKGFTFLIFGLFLALIFLLFLFTIGLSPLNVFIICISSLILIVYGLILVLGG